LPAKLFFLYIDRFLREQIDSWNGDTSPVSSYLRFYLVRFIKLDLYTGASFSGASFFGSGAGDDFFSFFIDFYFVRGGGGAGFSYF